jgi:hypothetical protein
VNSIYVSSAPIGPLIRLGISGTPIFRVGNTDDESILPMSDVVGFLDLRDQNWTKGESLVYYAGQCDGVIKEGWNVVEPDFAGWEREHEIKLENQKKWPQAEVEERRKMRERFREMEEME